MKHVFTLCLLALFTSAISQNPAIQWQKSFGGSNMEYANDILQTPDGGYITVGASVSNDGQTIPTSTLNAANHGGYDFWVVKTDANGNIEWQSCYGGTANDYANAVCLAPGGGYVIAGSTSSNTQDVSGNHGGSDCWIIRIDSAGSLLWQKAFGGSLDEEAHDIIAIPGGGYMVAAQALSSNGNVTMQRGNGDCWIFEIDNNGTMQWQKSYGGNLADNARSICPTNDGNYMIAGDTRSYTGDVVGGTQGASDFWVYKITPTGTLIWQKTLGGSSVDYANSIVPTSDGGYVVVGATYSSDGDIVFNKGWYDYWIVKLTAAGTIQWQRTMGGLYDDVAYRVLEMTDGSILVAGEAQSLNGDVHGNHGSGDFWIVRLASTGAYIWQLTLGSSGAEGAYALAHTADNSYAIAGYSADAANGDVTSPKGSYDFWVVKLGTAVGIHEAEDPYAAVQAYPNPAHDRLNIKGSNTLKGQPYALTDLMGKRLVEGRLDETDTQVSMESLSPGVYFLTVGNDHRHTCKVIKD